MITKETFINIINEIKKHTEIADRINKELRTFDFMGVGYGGYEGILVNLLEDIFKDESEWIGYFLYE